MDLEIKNGILLNSKLILHNPEKYSLQESSRMCSREGGPSPEYCKKLFLAYRRMSEGEVFRDELSDEMVKFFLDDFAMQGQEELRMALESTKKYLDYREEYGTIHSPLRLFCQTMAKNWGIRIDFKRIQKSESTENKSKRKNEKRLISDILDRMKSHLDSTPSQMPWTNLTDESLREKLESINNDSKRYSSEEVTEYARNGYVTELTLRRAKGFCELCRKEAPFMNLDGLPFLEVHHIEWLSIGGRDYIDNTAALCPNCHRRVHIICDMRDLIKLINVRKINNGII